MNSVALPIAGGGGQILSAEADLVRQAARGDAGSFSELMRRHSAPAWRLAQAVTPDRDAAVGAFRDGFVRAVRSGRSLRRSDDTFRIHVLSAIYKSAADHSYESAAPVRPVRLQRQKGGPDAALADTAFRSLPERWRAAVWLSQVENFDNDRMAAVLGVSAGVADQLVVRGLKGLAGRYEQARRQMPAHMGDVLRPLALAVPADLDELTAARWSVTGTEHLTSMVPLARWLDDHAARPLAVAAGALVGLGLIGLGVIPGGHGLSSQLGAAGSSSVPGSQTISACIGASCPAGSGAALSRPVAAPFDPFALVLDRVNGAAASGSGSSGSLTPNSTGTGTGGTGGNPAGPNPPSGPGTPTKGPNPAPGVAPSLVRIPGIASITLSQGSLTATVLNQTATASTSTSAGSCPASTSVNGTSAGAGCTSTPTTASTNSSNPVTGVVKQVVTGTSSAVSGIVQAVTGTPSTTTTTLKKTSGGLLSGL